MSYRKRTDASVSCDTKRDLRLSKSRELSSLAPKWLTPPTEPLSSERIDRWRLRELTFRGGRLGAPGLVELTGIEPVTSALQGRRSPS